MSKILYIGGVVSYEQKGVLAYLLAAVGSFAVYVTIVVGRADGGPLTEVPYVSTMLWMIGVSVAISTLARVAIEIARPSETHVADARDKEISRFGDWVGGSVLVVGALGTLVLAVLEVDHFWIANTVYLAFVVQAIVSSVVKLGAYRFGL